MRKFVGSALVALIAFTVATAAEYTGIISKYEDGKVSFKSFGIGGGGKKGAGEEKTLPAAGSIKFRKAKFNLEDKKLEDDGAYEGGKEAFEKAVKAAAEKKVDPDKAKGKGKKGFGGFGGGVFGQIITEGEGDNEKITEIRVLDFGGFKKKAQ